MRKGHPFWWKLFLEAYRSPAILLPNAYHLATLKARESLHDPLIPSMSYVRHYVRGRTAQLKGAVA